MNKESITLYSQPGCGTCIATKRAFNANKYTFTEIDISKDHDAYEYVTKKLGYSQLPVIETDSDNWSGLDLDKINNIK